MAAAVVRMNTSDREVTGAMAVEEAAGAASTAAFAADVEGAGVGWPWLTPEAEATTAVATTASPRAAARAADSRPLRWRRSGPAAWSMTV